MGNKNSNLGVHKKYNIFIQVGDNTFQTESTDIKNSNNTNYVYFNIKNMSVMDLLNKNIKIYVSRTITENGEKIDNDIYEDKIDTLFNGEPVKNKIMDQTYYDFKINTEDSKYIIMRYENIRNKQFKIIYVD
jgi:hypothetical protein